MSPASPTRRRFLGTLVAGAALAAGGRLRAAPPAGPAAVAGSPGPETAAGPETVHVFTKPFHALDYAATAALVAEAGFGGLDLTVRAGGHVAPGRAAEDLPRAVAAARAAGLEVATISTGIVAATAESRRLLTVARDLGIRAYRLGNFTYDRALGPWATLARLKPQLRALAALNEELGLHGGIQNHTGPWRVGAAGWDLHELVRDLDPRWLGCQYDIRHATSVGGTSWVATLELLAPWIGSLVLKDFRWIQRPGAQVVENVPLGEGVCDLTGFLRRVRELGLRVPWSLHLEFPPFEPAPSADSAAARDPLRAGLRRERATLDRLLAAARA
jgi:sugar phosphate isomerase/epimerase